jgi:uncharacterized protein YndB with AHSA1/START domain
MSHEKGLTIIRMVNAPRELVFKAWSSAEHLMHWYAPQGCTLPYCKVDFKVGGNFHHCIRTPQGDCWCKGIYKEIVPAEKLVYTLVFSDEKGGTMDESPVGKHPDWPLETTVTILLEEENGKIKITLHQTVSEDLAKETGAYPSWLQMLDRLQELLIKKQTSTIKTN